MQTAPRHTIILMPLDKIQPAPTNPKLHDIQQIRQMISRFGFTTPGLIDQRTGTLVAGHGRLEALQAMHADGETPPSGITTDERGHWLVPIITGWASTSDAEAAAYLVGDNQATINGGWNNADLYQLITNIDDPSLVELIGVNLEELAELIGESADDVDELIDSCTPPGRSTGAWPSVSIQAPAHIIAAWQDHASLYANADHPDAEALAALLGADLEPL